MSPREHSPVSGSCSSSPVPSGGVPGVSSSMGKDSTSVAWSMFRCSWLISRMPSSVVSSTSTEQGMVTFSAASAAVMTRVSRGL